MSLSKATQLLYIISSVMIAVLLCTYSSREKALGISHQLETLQLVDHKSQSKPIKDLGNVQTLNEDSSNNTTINFDDKNNVKIPILMYHSINIKSTNNLIITPIEFQRQMKWLKDNNFTTLHLNEVYSMLATGKNVPLNPVGITFDDGYKDNYTYAFPILKKYSFKATIFIITSVINSGNYYLNEGELKELYLNNIDIQSHTMKHIELNKLSYQRQLEEVTKSKEFLELMLNKDVDYLCYPVGKYNTNTLAALKVAGYKLAFTTKPGHAKFTDGLLTLPRVRMVPGMSMKVLSARKSLRYNK